MEKNVNVQQNELIQQDVDTSKDTISFSNKMISKLMQGYAKVLGKKKFKKSKIQEKDDQIISVVQEVYLPPEERKEQIGDWVLDKNLSFLVHAAYVHNSENLVLICYRGTDFKNVKDIISDVQIVLGVNGIDGRVRESLEFYDKVQMHYPNARKWVCGHSLGGTISYVATKHRSPERCVVFNPGASPTKTFLGMMQDTLTKKEWTKSITTYKVRGDVVSALSFIGNVKSFIVKSASPLKLHTIDSFPELFEKEKNL